MTQLYNGNSRGKIPCQPLETPKGEKMYADSVSGNVIAISDIHGEAGKADAMLNYLVKHDYHKDRWIVFLGDYVDRGPDSNATIHLLINFQKFHPQTTFLCGNHDLNLVKALNLYENPHQAFYWERIPRRNADVMRSYQATDGMDLWEKMPLEHKWFLMDLPWCVEHPDFFFVHAGLDPTESYEDQVQVMKERDMGIFKPKWMYDDRLAFVAPTNTPKTVVSGHTILQKPIREENRVLIDTGCGYGGPLTALFLPEYKILQA